MRQALPLQRRDAGRVGHVVQDQQPPLVGLQPLGRHTAASTVLPASPTGGHSRPASPACT